MNEIEEMGRAVRRVFPPEDPAGLRDGRRLADAICVRRGDLEVEGLGPFMTAVSLCCGEGRIGDLILLGRDGVVIPPGQSAPGARLVVRPLAEPFRCPDLPRPSREDAARLRDLTALRGGLSLAGARPLAPTADPGEAEEWLLIACAEAGLGVDEGRITTPLAPVRPDVQVDSLGGSCPVQADGLINGVGFYYRARGSRQSVETDDGFVMDERVLGGPYDAGYVPDEAAIEFIRRAALADERYASVRLRPCPEGEMTI